MRLIVVGCAAAWARGSDAASSCYLVESGETALLLDLGQGAFARLAAIRPPETLHAVLVTHLHPDHCVDLIPLRHYLRYDARVAPGTVELHAPTELPARFEALLGEAGFLVDLAFSPLAPGERRIGGLVVSAARVTHGPDAFAFRVAEQDSAAGLVYSGDCGNPADLVPLLRPGDTLLAEASFGAGPVPQDVSHLNAAGAAQAAGEAAAGRLVLTHLQRGVDPQAARRAAADVFAGETLLARPGLVLTV